MIFCDDEVCCFASEGERFCWRFSGCIKGQTPAKNKGSARHLAGITWEGGNGYLSMDHGGADAVPPPGGGVIMLDELREYIRAKRAAENPAIPRHANVMMRPGKNEEGWWAGEEKQMQMELFCDVFNVVFSTDLPLDTSPTVNDLEAALARVRACAPDGKLPYTAAVQLDRSQNHLARAEDALHAGSMRKGRGITNNGKNAHIRPTTFPIRPGQIARQLNCMGPPGVAWCPKCKATVDAYGGYGPALAANLQTIGYKGVEFTLKERGIVTAGKNLDELAPILAAMDDFKAEQSAVQTI